MMFMLGLISSCTVLFFLSFLPPNAGNNFLIWKKLKHVDSEDDSPFPKTGEFTLLYIRHILL